MNYMNNKISNINDNKNQKNNKYKTNNEHIDKLINFTNTNISKFNDSSENPKSFLSKI